ncbi:zinc ribbon domain-containing protein [Tautonia marina]|uniref:zinc ribbon domain-containing protein n=1 Tax=Tautonia marina TaxID=2653855 RepID=UPI0012605CF6
MSLVRCSECGQSISNRAASCPHCGYKAHRSASGLETVVMSVFRIVMLLLTVFAVVAGFIFPFAWILAILFLVLGIAVKRVA